MFPRNLQAPGKTLVPVTHTLERTSVSTIGRKPADMTMPLTATMPVPHLTGVALPMSVASATRRQLAGAVLLDVRRQVARHQGSIAGAVVVEPTQLQSWLATAELDPDRDIIVCSISDQRAIAAAQLLAGSGFPHVYYLAGGYTAWHNLHSER